MPLGPRDYDPHLHRTAVYAVATADRLGRRDLAAVHARAKAGDDSDPIVQLALWFDAATYPLPASMTAEEALRVLDDQGFGPEIVAAFRAVQPLIQPVGLD